MEALHEAVLGRLALVGEVDPDPVTLRPVGKCAADVNRPGFSGDLVM